jgi:hypothetical protein
MPIAAKNKKLKTHGIVSSKLFLPNQVPAAAIPRAMHYSKFCPRFGSSTNHSIDPKSRTSGDNRRAKKDMPRKAITKPMLRVFIAASVPSLLFADVLPAQPASDAIKNHANDHLSVRLPSDSKAAQECAHSTPLREGRGFLRFGHVLDCACPLALWNGYRVSNACACRAQIL